MKTRRAGGGHRLSVSRTRNGSRPENRLAVRCARRLALEPLEGRRRLDVGPLVISEFLAVNDRVRDDGITIASQFSRQFPNQRADISYGVPGQAAAVVLEGSGLKYRVPTSADSPLGTSWRALGFDDSAWSESEFVPPHAVLITEIGTGSPDYVEIQNLSGEPVDTTGWVVVANNAFDGVPLFAPDINAFHSTLWELPLSISDRELLYRSDLDDGSGHYWGGNVFWRVSGNGWAMIVDDVGSVADFVVWGYMTAEIATLDVTIGGHRITADDFWIGDAAVRNDDAGHSLERFGNADHDDNSDWMVADSPSLGSQNDGLAVPFVGQGMPGIGFENNPPGLRSEFDIDIGAAMHGVNASVWSRIPFDVPDPAALDTLQLRIKYNDGFVAYLNGEEIASANAPESPQWNSSATDARSVPESLVWEEIDVSDSLGALVTGTNVLAIHGLNVSAGDDNFLVLPELIGGRSSTRILSSGDYQGEIRGTGDIVVEADAEIVLTGDTWLHADSDGDGIGSITMLPGSSIRGNSYYLEIYGSEDGILRDVFDTASLILHQSKTGSNPTYYSSDEFTLPENLIENNSNLYVFDRRGHDGSLADPFELYTIQDVQAISIYSDKSFVLVNDIDASETLIWNTGKGFDPLGWYNDWNDNKPFTGVFNGNSHTLTGLFINRPDENYVGLFGYTNNSGIYNVGLEDISVTSKTFVGGLIGYSSGFSFSPPITHCYTEGNVTGVYIVGGLVGESDGDIENSHANVDVSGETGVGGLVGYDGGIIQDSYATGNVSGTIDVGGLVGATDEGLSIVNSYATGNVIGNNRVGGLVGATDERVAITNCYATGKVSGDLFYVGGLVGHYDFDDGFLIRNSYFTDASHGNFPGLEPGGIQAFMTTTHSVYWEDGIVDSTPAWDFTTPIWKIVENQTLPYLAWQTLVVGKFIFYNNSFWDTPTPENPDLNDDTAIAPDKAVLLPGETATFANYTSYSRGINGIMVDVANPAVTPTADDFELKVGKSYDLSTWASAPAPTSVTVRPGEGVNGSDRVTIIWSDNAVEKEWLQVTVLANADTGLIEPDVFYFGNAIGESGNSTTDAKVNIFDMLAARDNPRTFLNPAPIDFDFDFNRDARVNAFDMLIARDNQTSFLNALELITVPDGKGLGGSARLENARAHDAVLSRAVDRRSAGREASFGKPAWLYQFEPTGISDRPSKPDRPGQGTVHEALATQGL